MKSDPDDVIMNKLVETMKKHTLSMEDHVFSVHVYLRKGFMDKDELEEGCWQLTADGLTAREMWEKHGLLTMDTWLVKREDFERYEG